MENPVIAAIGAFGAWLLVAGPLYQATIELRDQGMAQRRDLPNTVSRPRAISGWWWLLPPVAYWKHHAEKERIRRLMLTELPPGDVEQMISFTNTARGWLVVAGGATLNGVKETWELVDLSEWPAFMTWIITAAALLLAVGNAVVTANRTGKILATLEPERA